MSTDIAALVTDNLEVLTRAVEQKSGAGRGGARKLSLYGIERLRELILDLAVRGRLVPQDVRDEPAATLLTHIRKQQNDLVKSGQIGKPRKVSGASDKPPFDIPPTWQWVQIAEIGHDWGQREPEQDFTYIDVGSIDQKLGLIREPSIVTAGDAPSRARKIVRPGTVIYSTVRPYLLNVAIVDKAFSPEPIASTAFAIVHPFDGIEAGFVYRYLRSPTFIRYVENCQTGIAYPAINDRQFFSAWFPVPPKAEQQRIVVKVDELMALCDALEALNASAMETQNTLVETLLVTLVNSADWRQLETHFDTLFTTEASIEFLKRTILELAIRGKLVEQSGADEPATSLLSRVSNEIASYCAEHRIALAKTEKITKSDVAFDIPKSWAWARLSNVFKVITDGDHQPPPKAGQGIAFLTIGNIASGNLNFEGCRFVPDKYFRSLARYRTPEKGDILYTVVGTFGRPAVVETDRDFCVQRHIAILKPSKNMSLTYLIRLLQSPFVYEQASKGITGIAQPTLALRPLRNFLVPVPPLAEQHRIAKKVEELLLLCDGLKNRIADVGETRRHLADAIVERAAA